jgi:hypothetical protein
MQCAVNQLAVVYYPKLKFLNLNTSGGKPEKANSKPDGYNLAEFLKWTGD